MKVSRCVLVGAVSYVCRAQAFFLTSSSRSSSSNGSSGGFPPHSGTASDRRLLERDGKHSERWRRPWLVTGGGVSSASGERQPNSRWWRSRKRRAKRQAEIAERQAAQHSLHRSVPLTKKHVVLLQGVLRQLRRWLGFIVDITTLKRLRLLRRARQVRAWKQEVLRPSFFFRLLLIRWPVCVEREPTTSSFMDFTCFKWRMGLSSLSR